MAQPVSGFGSPEPAGGPRVNVVAVAVLVLSVLVGVGGVLTTGSPIPLIVTTLVGIVLMQSPRIAQQWERGVVLRLGRFVGLRGPGLFWIVPFIDTVSAW